MDLRTYTNARMDQWIEDHGWMDLGTKEPEEISKAHARVIHMSKSREYHALVWHSIELSFVASLSPVGVMIALGKKERFPIKGAN